MLTCRLANSLDLGASPFWVWGTDWGSSYPNHFSGGPIHGIKTLGNFTMPTPTFRIPLPICLAPFPDCLQKAMKEDEEDCNNSSSPPTSRRSSSQLSWLWWGSNRGKKDKTGNAKDSHARSSSAHSRKNKSRLRGQKKKLPTGNLPTSSCVLRAFGLSPSRPQRKQSAQVVSHLVGWRCSGSRRGGWRKGRLLTCV